MRSKFLFSSLLITSIAAAAPAIYADEKTTTDVNTATPTNPLETNERVLRRERDEQKEKVMSREDKMSKDMKKEQEGVKEKMRTHEGDMRKDMDRETVWGSSIMTEQERKAHREHMRTATTEEERQKIRLEHHEKMAKRAKERGVTLPEDPAMRGKKTGWVDGENPGKGKGPGMGKPDKAKPEKGKKE